MSRLLVAWIRSCSSKTVSEEVGGGPLQGSDHGAVIRPPVGPPARSPPHPSAWAPPPLRDGPSMPSTNRVRAVAGLLSPRSLGSPESWAVSPETSTGKTAVKPGMVAVSAGLYCPQSAYTRGVNPDSTYYVLNPHGNLPGTEERFRDWFQSESKWNGVTGKAPRPEHVQAGITQHDLYIYAGHGAGAYFLDGQALLKLDCNAVSLLFGCSSAALAVRGKLEGAGIILKYLMAGCPLVLGNLWDVTDRDIDRYMAALLKNWMKAGSGAPILPYIAQSRQAPKLKFLIGAAPIAYGMPVALR